MFSRPDPQSYTKFALSAGVFLIVAAFLIPGLILRETGVLRISKQQLSGLTPLARQELERRQRFAEKAGGAAPYLFAILLAGGFVLVVYGVPRLKRQEESDEERSSIEIDKLRSEIKPQSQGEREERLTAEAEEELGYEPPPTASVPGEEPQRPPAPPPSPPSPSLRGHVQRAAAVEERVLVQIARIAGPMYQLRANVKLEGPSRMLLDGVLVSELDQVPDIVIEIKRTGEDLANARRRLSNAIFQLKTYLRGYQEFVKPHVMGWLIFVVDGPMRRADRHRLADLAAGLSAGLQDIRISLIGYDELDGLSLPPVE